MKTICVLSGKGGVGKTATVKNIAHIVGTYYNKKVLVVDMDPQGNTSSMYGDIDFTSLFVSIVKGVALEKTESVEDLLLDSQMDVHRCIRHTRYENIDIIPAFLTLAEVEEKMKADIRTPQQFKLKVQLEKIKNEYDFCFIDCGPSISLLNVNALAASEEVFFPTKVDADSFVGIAIAMNLVKTVQCYNPGLKIGGAFFTQFNGRKNVSQVAYDTLSSLMNGKIIPIKIGISKYVEEQSFQQEPLLVVDNKMESKVTKQYIQLAGYLITDDRTKYVEELEESER